MADVDRQRVDTEAIQAHLLASFSISLVFKFQQQSIIIVVLCCLHQGDYSSCLKDFCTLMPFAKTGHWLDALSLLISVLWA